MATLKEIEYIAVNDGEDIWRIDFETRIASFVPSGPPQDQKIFAAESIEDYLNDNGYDITEPNRGAFGEDIPFKKHHSNREVLRSKVYGGEWDAPATTTIDVNGIPAPEIWSYIDGVLHERFGTDLKTINHVGKTIRLKEHDELMEDAVRREEKIL